MAKTATQTRRSLGLLSALVLVAGLLPAQIAWAQADAGISTTQTVGPAAVGQPYAFTVTVTNGSVPQLVGLKDFLPQGLSLEAATPSQGTCGTGYNGVVECGLGEIPSGGSATVEIVATPTVPGTFANTAVGQGEVSPATPANSSVATITVSPAA